MFINRKDEIDFLNKKWGSKRPELLVIYGRRRIGKSTLLLELIKNKTSVYFQASEATAKDSLNDFSKVLLHNKLIEEFFTFNDWEDAFELLSEKSKNERLLIVLDEIQFIANEHKGWMSKLQRFWDQKGSKSNMVIILCTSHISFMESKVISYKAPLYGRITGVLKLEPFNYIDASLFVEKYNPVEKLYTYSIFGGTPAYLSLLDEKMSWEENVIEKILPPNERLFDEPNLILKSELREITKYSQILLSVSTGATKMKDITSRLSMSASEISQYLKILIELGYMQKEIPVNEDEMKSRKAIYKLKDPLFYFWYRFILPNQSLLKLGNQKDVFNKVIYPNLDTHIGFSVFESICMEYVRRFYPHNKEFMIKKMGRFVTGQVEIDIFTYNTDKTNTLASCKWSSKPYGPSIISDLAKQAEVLRIKSPRFLCFSSGGFTKDTIDFARVKNVELIDAKDLLTL
ncbi:MAG: AAA family ATPase [Candidatus Melainabacteria bacterium]|nr:AAA family ATPase [Candidatus Melainabacteria bacterium]